MENLKDKIEGFAKEVMKVLGPGYKEGVYEKALAHELRLHNISYERQTNIEITYKGYYLKDVLSDIIVDDSLLLELKAVQKLGKKHLKQAMVYMFSLDIDEGMLLSFSEEGVVLRKDVKKPALQEPGGKVVIRDKNKNYGNIGDILKDSAKEIMERFGTEFMFTDAKFDMYIKALGVDLTLKNINYKSSSGLVCYKDCEVDRKEIEFMLDDNSGILPFSYKKVEDINKQKAEVPLLISILSLDSIWLVGFPEKEGLEIYLEKMDANAVINRKSFIMGED
ncbi:MAG: GxxExxY protein [candidate division WOR-3 bacterium]|nr:GxxExxY protein [candidate division WOR-3 bacterium]